MKYIPGIIHEKYQESWYFILNNDFNWSNCDGLRWSDFSISDYDNNIKVVKLEKFDIIKIKFFKPQQASNAHCYIESVIRGEKETVYNTETIISRDFIEKNLTTSLNTRIPIDGKEKCIFSDVTFSMKRDNKIKQILTI